MTNLAEPSVPKSPLSIPTSILKRHSVTRGSAVVEDMADLTTTWGFLPGTTTRRAIGGICLTFFLGWENEYTDKYML